MSAADTGISDPSALQTINFGGGVTGFYDPNSATYYDSGFNALSPNDLAQYGAFTVGTGTTPAPPSLGGGSSAPPAGSGSGGFLSGLTGVFSAIGNGVATGYRAVNPTISPPAGSLVYNPQTGGYTTQAALTAQSTLNPMLLLLLGAVVIYLVVKHT
jgi:hypothetical protein